MLFQAFSERFQIPVEDSMKSKKWEKIEYRSLLGVEMFAWAGTQEARLSYYPGRTNNITNNGVLVMLQVYDNKSSCDFDSINMRIPIVQRNEIPSK